MGRGIHIGTATNRSNGPLQLPSFSYVLSVMDVVLRGDVVQSLPIQCGAYQNIGSEEDKGGSVIFVAEYRSNQA